MCGIAGIVSWEAGEPSHEVDHVERMVSQLAHRGPDGAGTVSVGPPGGATVVFGHRRLSIIDLSDRAAQPMHDSAGNWITYNGEIYNFADLRRQLEAHGHQFRSESDTEVILHGYRQWGPAVFGRLRGMFALGLWDASASKLVLVRDRFGIKPLYVWRHRGRVIFASEVRALLASGLVPRRLDRVALEQYLTWQTVPAPRTLVEGVSLLLPATLTTHDADGERREEYWYPLAAASSTTRPTSEAEARAGVHARLVEAAKLHLVSDVPVGVFLSGGIDSSAVVSLVRQTGVTPRTFAVTFPGTPYDEAAHARRVAEAFETEHTEIPLGERDLRDDMPEALDAIDHPSGDGINSLVVSRAVRAAGVKVALSGLGGDELFCGYPSFRRMATGAAVGRVWRRSPPDVRSAAARAVRSLGGDSIAATKTAALLETDASFAETFPLLRQLFSIEQRRALIGPAAVEQAQAAEHPYRLLLERAVTSHSDLGLMSLVSFAEARTYMHDVLLRDTDQMSMRYGLEVRVPLLDHVLAEYVLGLGDRWKMGGPTPKRLLVESLGGPLPASIVDRPKQGFVLPFDAWMRGDLRALCERHLGPEGLLSHGLFDAVAVTSLWSAFLDRSPRTSWARLWALVALNAWMERTGVAPA